MVVVFARQPNLPAAFIPGTYHIPHIPSLATESVWIAKLKEPLGNDSWGSQHEIARIAASAAFLNVVCSSVEDEENAVLAVSSWGDSCMETCVKMKMTRIWNLGKHIHKLCRF